MEGRVNCGKVNCDQHEWLCRQAGIQAYPTVRFYGGVKKTGKQQVNELWLIKQLYLSTGRRCICRAKYCLVAHRATLLV